MEGGQLLSLEGLIDQVQQWGYDKEIIQRGTTIAQGIKTMEEAMELLSAINFNDLGEIKDGIGDTLVTLILQSEMQGMDLRDCLRTAYLQIASREGRIINGQFIKEA